MVTQGFLTIDADDLSPEAFIEACKHYLDILKEVDREASGGHQSLRWRLTTLRKGSPAVVGMEPIRRSARSRGTPELDVARTVSEGIASLEAGAAEPPAHFTPRALDACAKLALLRTKGVTTVKIGFRDAQAEIQQKELTERTLASVKNINAERYVEDGVLEGLLCEASIKLKDRFDLRESVFGVNVQCTASRELVLQAGGMLDSRVRVEGELRSDARGMPIRIHARRIEQLRGRDQLPQLGELFGKDPGFPGSASELRRTLRERGRGA